MTKIPDSETANALDYAREQERLSGEVRVLKWAVGAAFVALIAAFGTIYAEMNQGFRDVNQRFGEVNQQFRDVNLRIDQLTDSVVDVRERLTRVEGHVETNRGTCRSPRHRRRQGPNHLTHRQCTRKASRGTSAASECRARMSHRFTAADADR